MTNITHRSSSSVSAISSDNSAWRGDASLQNDTDIVDDHQLFFVTSYSDFDKLGKSIVLEFSERTSAFDVTYTHSDSVRFEGMGHTFSFQNLTHVSFASLS